MKRLLVLLLICFGCSAPPPVERIKLQRVNNDSSLKITGLNNLVIQEIARDKSDSFEGLFPVYHMPKDTDLKDYQPIQPVNI